MKCSNCGAELAEGAKFCGECGTKVVKAMFCPECGAKCAPGVKFCSECGHKLGGVDAAPAKVVAGTAQSVSAKYIDKNCYAKTQMQMCRNLVSDQLSELREAECQGDGDASYVLGWHACTIDDEDGAMSCFRKGAERGSGYAKFALARYAHDDNDCERSMELLKEAALDVGVPAYWELAMTILEGHVDRPWNDALPYLEKIIQRCKEESWDVLFGETASVLLKVMPEAASGDVESMIALYECLVELEEKSEAHDEAVGFGVNSWTRGSSLGQILVEFEKHSNAQMIDRVVNAYLGRKDAVYWFDDMYGASEMGSQIAKTVMRMADENEGPTAERYAGEENKEPHNDDDDDEDEMLDEDDEE